ncbi:MAG: nicotinate (nicotinamide) nucleotide adenylyltransferase [Pseudomonadota bacterium]
MIGIFGGTFDPPHLGHSTLAESVWHHCRLSQIRWIPLNQAVHKTQPLANPAQRLAMVQAAIAGYPTFYADPCEIERRGPSYMVDTLTTLHTQLPGQTLCLMIGSDTFSQLSRWKTPHQILQLAHLIVVRRADHPQTPPANLTLHNADTTADLHQCSAGLVYQHTITPPAISSTAIRSALTQGDQTISRHLSPAVWALIRQQKLYQPAT